MLSITISAAGPPVRLAPTLPISIGLPDINPTVSDVKAAIYSRFPKFHPSRQKITLPLSQDKSRKPLDDESTLASLEIQNGGELSVKDLGPQIGWRTVFVVEYLGPLIIHPLLFHFPGLFYGAPVQHGLLQKIVYSMVLVHFVKRELETLFVHRFSHTTMPVRNIFKNSAHYWILSGVFLAYPIYSPTYASTSPYIMNTRRADENWLRWGVAFWIQAELSNFITHLNLRSLRPKGTRARAIPHGYGFSLVSCPNYSFEIVGWVVISVLTGSWSAWLFAIVSTGQMLSWALKKHRAYKKEFGKEYPPGRKALIPFIL